MRAVIAINVINRAVKVFPKHPNLPVAIKEAAGNSFSKSTVQRILDAKVGTSLEQLDALARALELAPYQLLIQNLDPANPQVAKGASVDEQQLYRKIAREAVKEALETTHPGIGKKQHQEDV